MSAWQNQHPTKLNLSQEQEDFVRQNWEAMTNRELATAIGMKLQTFRTKAYALGLYRMELEYWTDEQVQFLQNHYQTIGDKELAAMMQERWPKKKGWTLKHIEKKRKYLKLKRTREEVKDIHQRNVDNGCFLMCPVKRWDKCGRAPEGEIRMWREKNKKDSRMIPRIKVNGKFVHWARWTWEQMNGPVPEGMNIVFKDNNPANHVSENLEMISNAELARRNVRQSSIKLTDNYIAGILTHGCPELRESVRQNKELIQVKRLQLTLQRNINALQSDSSGKEAAGHAQ